MTMEWNFWLTTTSMPPATAGNLPSQADVVIIGAGFTGLSAARTLAKKGATVAVLEANTIGWGASSRNGGMVLRGQADGKRRRTGRSVADPGTGSRTRGTGTRRRSSADECRGRVGARRSVAGGGGSHAGGRHLSSRSGDRAAGTAARTLSTAVVQLAAGDPYRYATGGSSVGGGWRRRIELPLSSNRWA